MQVKIGTLYSAAPALRQLAQQPLPIWVSGRVQRLLRKAAEEIDAFEALRARAIRRYAGYSEDGSDVPEGMKLQVPPERLEEFTNEVNAAAGDLVEVPWQPLETSTLGDRGEITPAALGALAWMFSDLEDPGSGDEGDGGSGSADDDGGRESSSSEEEPAASS